MKLAVTTFGGDGGKSGISRYIIQLLNEFARMDAADVDVFLYEKERDIFLKDAPGLNAVPCADGMESPMKNILWHQLSLPGRCKKGGYDLLFLPAGNRRLPFRSPVPTVGTVHDFSSLHCEGKYDRGRMFYIKKVLPMLVRKLTRVVTVSESSKRDIVHYAGVPPDKVDVTPLAADGERYRVRDPEEAMRPLGKYGIKGPFVLYVSRLEHPGKNHVRLIRAFDRLRATLDNPLQLVLCGGDWFRAEAVHEEAARAKHAGDIVFPGFVEEADLPLLYNAARALAFPSLYEGFGLPVLEAMASGLPVACANVSSMPEVAGDAALLFDPADEDAIEHALTRLVTEDDLHADLRAKGLARAATFSWERTARATWAAFERALEEACCVR